MALHHLPFLCRHQLTGLQPEGETGRGREGCVPGTGSLPNAPTPREGGNKQNRAGHLDLSAAGGSRSLKKEPSFYPLETHCSRSSTGRLRAF